jgi:hypothetical protein
MNKDTVKSKLTGGELGGKFVPDSTDNSWWISEIRSIFIYSELKGRWMQVPDLVKRIMTSNTI